MNNEEIAQELQKFIDAHNMNIEASTLLDNMDAGDFVALNQAMDNSDNRTIMQILQKYQSSLSEHYNKFVGDNIFESNSLIEQINQMPLNELQEMYKSNVDGALSDCFHLSLQELKTLVYESLLKLNEDITSTLTPQQLGNGSQQPGQNQNSQNGQNGQAVNPQDQEKLKQATLQRNATNSAFKVSVPSSSGDSSQISSLVGIDPGSSPDDTLVVTKDESKPNQVSIFGLDDVNPVEECEDPEEQEELEEPNADGYESPLSNPNPSMGELYKQIGDIESSDDDMYGEESPEGNEAMDNSDEMIKQILDFCSKMRGR